MGETLETLREVRQINASFPYTEPIREWKRQGKKVIGWQCSYTPEEIIYAAGMLPIRVTGDSREMECENANAYLYTNNCSFVRSCLEMALTNQLDFLDGYAASATCDSSRRLADMWTLYVRIPVIYILCAPRRFTERAHQLYKADVLEFKRRMEEFSKADISDQALWEAIKVYDRNRELLRKLYELRKADTPPISGAEMLEVTNANFRMPKDEANKLLERLLEEVSTSKRAFRGKRLMLSGTPLNNPDFIRVFEDLGGLVVVDEVCTGVRHWWDPVGIDSYPDPVEAISRRYLNNFPCTRMVPWSERCDRLLSLIKDYRVDGMVHQVIRCCAMSTHERPLLREKLEALGIPVLELDVEYGTGAGGGLMTRAQAFLEMLR